MTAPPGPDICWPWDMKGPKASDVQRGKGTEGKGRERLEPVPRGNFPTARPQAREKPTNTWAQAVDKSQRVQERGCEQNGPAASCPCSQPRRDAPHPTASLAGPGHPAAAPWQLPGKDPHSLPSSPTAHLPLWAGTHLSHPSTPTPAQSGGYGTATAPVELPGPGDAHGAFPLQL